MPLEERIYGKCDEIDNEINLVVNYQMFSDERHAWFVKIH